MDVLVLVFIFTIFAIVMAVELVPFLANKARERAEAKETQDLHKG